MCITDKVACCRVVVVRFMHVDQQGTRDSIGAMASNSNVGSRGVSVISVLRSGAGGSVIEPNPRENPGYPPRPPNPLWPATLIIGTETVWFRKRELSGRE